MKATNLPPEALETRSNSLSVYPTVARSLLHTTNFAQMSRGESEEELYFRDTMSSIMLRYSVSSTGPRRDPGAGPGTIVRGPAQSRTSLTYRNRANGKTYSNSLSRPGNVYLATAGSSNRKDRDLLDKEQ